MTSNAVKYRDTKMKERELDQKAKKLPHEIAMLEQERGTSAANAAKLREESKYIDTKRRLAPVDTVANTLAGAGKTIGGVAALVNDFSFYTKTGDAMLNLLKESTTDQAGRSKSLRDVFNPVAGDDYPAETNYDDVEDFKPSIFTYDFVPSIGHDLGQASSTAIAIRKFNTRVRGDNSGSTNYDSVDLFEYPLATDSIAYILAWLERGLDLVNHVQSRDLATLNNRLLIAHCWGRGDLANMFIQDSAGVLNVMNKVIDQLDALQIPFEIDYIKRHTWLCKKVFTYGSGVSRRYILFRPEIYRVYDEESGSIKAYSFRQAMIRFATDSAPYVFTTAIQNILNRMTGPLANSQATATMSGDIAKAFGYEGVQFQKYPLNYCDITSVAYEEDEKYLMSIRNAIISPLASTERNIALYGDELKDLSIRQVINEQLNPILFMGHLYESGDSQETCGPSLNKHTLAFVYNNSDNEIDYMDGAKSDISKDIFNYVDYLAENISEEDQLYNYSFKHNYEHGKDDNGLGTVGVNNCRSEIIVRGTAYYTSPINPKNWRSYQFETFMPQENGDREDLSAKDTLLLAHKFIDDHNFFQSIFGNEKFSPAIYHLWTIEGTLAVVPSGEEDPSTEAFGVDWWYLIWGRHYNRKINTTDDLEQINYEALVNLFIQGSSQRNRSSRRSKRR